MTGSESANNSAGCDQLEAGYRRCATPQSLSAIYRPWITVEILCQGMRQ